MIPRVLALGAIVLVSLLTWLGLNGARTGANVADYSLRMLDECAAAESALYRDILRARSGTLRNYDAIARGVARLESVLPDLRRLASSDPRILRGIEKLAERVRKQAQWSQRLTTNNALLQNSLAYFDVAGRRLAADAPAPLAQQVSALAAAILHLTMDASAEAVAEVDLRLAAMTPQRYSEMATVDSLRSHARLLRTLLPQTEGVMQSLFVVASGSELSELRLAVLERRREAEQRTAIFRYGLLGASLTLAAALLMLGVGLHRRSELLRRRAGVQQILADSSMRFINSRSDDLDTHIHRALAELAASCGASRAYFVTPDPVPDELRRKYIWVRPGMDFMEGQLTRIVSTARRMRSATNHLIRVPDVERMPYGMNRDGLLACGVRAWLCASSEVRGQEAMLGFDFERASPQLMTCEPALLSMAFDSIANVIERDLLERDRMRLEGNLQQARRLETIGSLASGIAHNFNNIIGAIVGFAESAQPHARRSPRVSENLEEIRTAGERARHLVGQILAFGRRGAMPPAPTSLNRLLKETRTLLEAGLPSGVELVVREPSQPVIVEGDASQLQQVILNVCTNASQAMDGKGIIEIELDVQHLQGSRRLEHGVLAAGPYAVLAITDEGRGIDDSIRARIFEPFFTTRLEGNGLGLATVREIVLEHDGGIAVFTAPGTGTRFEVWLPVASLEEVPETPEGHERRERGHGQSILVLDSDREHLLHQEDVIAALGYEPIGFVTTREAAESFAQSPSHFDAALLCCHELAAHDALGFAAFLRRQAPQLPIILSMPSSLLGGAPALARAGISAVVGQPVTASELAAVLSRHLRAFATRVTQRHADVAGDIQPH